jgi:hypothetical protein
MNEAIPHEATVCGAKTRKGTHCQRFGNHTGRCSKHGGKSLSGMASPRFKHGFYSRYLPRGWALQQARASRRCRVIKADSQRCRLYAKWEDDLCRCVAHQDVKPHYEWVRDKLIVTFQAAQTSGADEKL